jgi:single-strand DNA-binding protein
MPDQNTVVISGRLSRDPELRYTQQETAVAEFSIATSEEYEKNGEKKETTSFIDCKAWRGNAEKIAKQKKGDSVIAVGKLRVDSWEDKTTHQKRYKTYVLVEAVTNPFGGGTKKPQAAAAPPRPAPQPATTAPVEEDQCPF